MLAMIRSSFLSIAGFLLLIGSVTASSLEDLRGRDWIKMPLDQKQTFIYTGIGGLERQGVFITKSPDFYIQVLDRIIAEDPELSEEFLDNLFVFCVHESEPQTQEAIKKIREQSRTAE